MRGKLHRFSQHVSSTTARALRRLANSSGASVEDLPDHVREVLEYHWSGRDDKDNRELSLPSEEEIELHAVLMVEAYTPTNFANLTDWLTRQGWGEEEVFFGGPTLLSWVGEVEVL